MSTAVWFTSIEAPAYASKEAQGMVQWAIDHVSASGGRYRLAASPDRAEIILFILSGQHKHRGFSHVLLREPLIRQYPNRCFSFDYEADPPGFLPGVYVSMPAARFDTSKFHGGGYLCMYNSLIQNVERGQIEVMEPSLLVSFRGSLSSPIRGKLFESSIPSSRWEITQTSKWCNHDNDDFRQYLRQMLNSKFVLCPRGIGTATSRLFETMACGRVPVIISDQWVPPIGPDWPRFSIRIGENRISELSAILDEAEKNWRQMGDLARECFENWYKPPVTLWRTLEYIEDLMSRRPANHDEREYHDKWLTLGFAWRHGWTIPQKLRRAAADGVLLRRLRVHVIGR